MIHGFIVLKTPVINQKYGVVLPENTTLYYFVDDESRYFAQHPDATTIYTRVARRNIASYSPLNHKKYKVL